MSRQRSTRPKAKAKAHRNETATNEIAPLAHHPQAPESSETLAPDVLQSSRRAPSAQASPVKTRQKSKDVSRVAHTVFCCQASMCLRNGARSTWKALRHQVRSHGLKSDVQMVKTHCTGLCKNGPIVIVCAAHSPGGDGVVWYSNVKSEDAVLITHEHLANQRVVESKRFRKNTISSETGSSEDAASKTSLSETTPLSSVAAIRKAKNETGSVRSAGAIFKTASKTRASKSQRD